MLRTCVALICAVLLAACAGGEREPLSPDIQERVAYRHDGPPALTLVTMISNRTGRGGHSSLLVSGSQRVLFDPAGSFRPDWITEHGDVIYGMTPSYFAGYKSAHSRNSHHVVTQTFEVSPEVAELALAMVQSRGTVPGAFCANATSTILQQLPGFDSIKTTFLPENLMEQAARLPGVKTDKLFENDEGHVVDGITVLAPSE